MRVIMENEKKLGVDFYSDSRGTNEDQARSLNRSNRSALPSEVSATPQRKAYHDQTRSGVGGGGSAQESEPTRLNSSAISIQKPSCY